ncbi:MAG: ATP-binding protein [Bacteroidales bacterium]|nr:ATP-binding protein [Bacteroidales bacterium]
MDPVDNPYTPGAGTPPPELAGRKSILSAAENAIKRTIGGKAAKSQLMLGLRGVGKTVVLNRINQIAENEGCQTAIFEADPDHSLPELLTLQLHRLLLKLDRRKKVGNDIQKTFSYLRGFASTFRVKYGEFEVGLTNELTTGDLTIDLADLFVLIGKASKRRNMVSVILIDELQYVEREDLGALIMALHKILQLQLPLIFFGAGLPQLAKLAGDTKSYAERLFDYPEIDKLDDKSATQAIIYPAKREKVEFEPDAVDLIISETEGYPFFLQVWGSHVWEIAQASPITARDVDFATKKAIQALDNGFFKVRYERLTERQKEYIRAMAAIGHLPVGSSEVATRMNIPMTKAAPIREEIIRKGMIYSPGRGLISFSVPKFDEFLRRGSQF